MFRKRTVGFIGLGAMGTPIANRIMDAGWPLVVYNRTEGPTRPFAVRGAAVASSPKEVAEAADIIMTMVTDDAAVRDVAFGGSGIFAGLGEGKIYADVTTASPELALELESAAQGLGAKTLDVRVSGSTEPAQKGELLIMVGGDSHIIERIRPVLDVLGRKIVHTGGHGTAASMKIALNILLGLEMEALAEAFVLALKAGIAPGVIAETVGSSGIASPVITGKLKQIRNNDYQRRFALRLMQKDFTLALNEGSKLGVPLPTTAAANEVAKAGMASGYAERDFGALYLAIAGMSHVEAKPAPERVKEPAQAV